ncbi:MAG: FG-GAP-like repeat-containing protein, partial [Pseudomonadota bacterium]|nr:FG-GAP-like repeat-containing protein [Pseudomonadota bacterium]
KVIVVPVYTSGASAGSPVESMLMVTEASGRYFLGAKPAFLTEAEEGMQLVLSPEKQVIGANEEVRYKISVGNTGTDAVTGLTLKMPVPENMTYVSSSDNGNVIDGNVVWTIDTMNPAIGDTRFVTFLSNADLNNGDVLETEAWLETTQRLQRSTDSLVIRNNIALTLTATVLGDQRQYNHFAYFKYVIANEGALNISDVSLYINTASRTSYRQVSPGLTGGCTNECDPGEWGRWEFGTLAPGESRVVTVPVGMTSNVFGEPLESHALVTEGSGRYTLSLRPTVVNQSEAGMQLSMTPDKQMLEPGDVVEYQLAYGNTGADALTSGTLVMPIPAGMTYLSSSDNGEFAGDQVSWNLATVNPGIGNLRTVKLQVSNDLPEGSVVAFESMILNPDRIQRSTDSVVITDNLDLTLTTTVSKEMHQNGFYTYYHYTVANKGMLDIADIQMWMKTGLRTNFSNAMPRISGGCTNDCDANEWARWDIGTLSPGESSVITIPLYSSNPIVGEPLESHVAVRDASGRYWLGTRPTLIARDSAVMDVALTSTTSLVEPGETQEFTFAYGNPTSDTYENALLSLPLPMGYTLQQASGTYELVDDTVYWPLGDIAPNKGGQLSVSLLVDSNITPGEVLKLHASLDSGGNIHQSTGSSIATTVAGSLPFSLDVDSEYTTPLVPYSVLDTTLTASVLSQTQLANVRMFALTSQYTTAANTGMTGGCTNSCDSGEWARWEMGNMDAGHQEAKLFTQTASGSLFGGKLLISNYMLFTDSSPNLTQAIMHVAPAGDLVSVNALEDTDGDGIPDWWEIRYMPYMNWLDSADASYDADSDGYSNYDEYANDKIPTDDISTPDDFDGDLISDLLDEDDDNDGYPDTEDAYPFDASKHRLVKNDVNGDGNSDILWRSYTKGWNFLWAMDGTATASTTPINVVPGTAWDMVGQGDYDADGKSDIFWRNNDTGQNFIYLMDGAVYKSRYTLNYVGATDWRVAGSGDFDGDGKGDVLWRNINRGDTWFYLMDAGVIRDSLPSLLVADTDYEIVATGDIDGDGDDDVIWRHSVSGVNYIWLMQGGSIVSRYTLNTVNTEWDIAGTGDLDGDGTDDIILRNQVSGENWVYFMEAGQIRESTLINTVADTNWQIANIGDYDGDGKSDFLWRHAEDARNIIHLMDGTTRKASGVLKNTDETWRVAQ